MPSWRDTLFIWSGALKDDKWDGAWVGVDNADATAVESPSAQDFSDSSNKFTVNLETVGGSSAAFSHADIRSGAEVEATAGLGYLLDQGDGQGHTRYHDDKHRVRFCRTGEGDSDTLLVAAIGTTPFGPFVSLGKCTGTEFVLARRYIDEKDYRSQWTLDDLDAAAGSPFNANAPWCCAALHAKTTREPPRKTPKRKTADGVKTGGARKEQRTGEAA